MMRRALALALALVLTGPAQAQTALAWTATTTGSGTGLILGPPGGEPVFSLACLRGTREVLAIVYKLKPDAGPELTLKLGDQLFGFVLKPQTLREGKMVQASAKAGPDLLGAIRRARDISGTYGKAKIGPYPAPPPALSDGFADVCGPLV